MTVTRKRLPLSFSYSIGGNTLAVVNRYKYLGVTIMSDLRWNEHISEVVRRAMRKLGYLKRNLRQCTHEVKLIAYKTLVRPVLEYASIVWDPYTQGNINKIESVQKKAARFVYRSYSWRTSASALVKKAGLECLQKRRQRDRLKFMHLLFHDKLGIHKHTYIEPVSKRATRSHHNKKIKEYSCRTETFANSFFPRTIREWNRLPAGVVECPTTDSFVQILQL